MIPLLCLLALVITGLTHWVYRWRNPKCNGVLPPGSMGFPIIGETLQFFSVHPLEGVPPFISKRVSRYGTFFKTSIVGQPVVVSTDPEINHHIFQQEGKLFQCWYTESAGQLLGEQGWSVHSGAMHKYIRSLALRLIGPESLKDGLLPEMDEMTQKHLHLWTGHANIDVKEATTTMIFALAAKKLLCCNEEEASKLGREFKDFSNGFISFPLYVPGTACYAALKGRRSAINVIKNTLDQRRSSTKRNNQDFLDHLLEEMEDEEAPLNESIAVDLVFLLFFAAYETTSSAITLAIKFLNDYPEALKKLKEENETIIRNREKKESVFTWAEYKSMTFTNMVINETVRLANIVPGIFRKVMDDVQIKGYTIPAGWTLMVCPPSIHLDANNYKDPFVFNPWRWNGQELHVGSKKFIAFGGGSRLCAGADFAKVQMAIFLHHLVTKYRWEVIKEGKILRKPGLTFGKGLRIQIFDNEGE